MQILGETLTSKFCVEIQPITLVRLQISSGRIPCTWHLGCNVTPNGFVFDRMYNRYNCKILLSLVLNSITQVILKGAKLVPRVPEYTHFCDPCLLTKQEFICILIVSYSCMSKLWSLRKFYTAQTWNAKS